MKYWVCKRGAPLAAEALECLGGNGYVEEAPMAQFYRDIQLGTVWEGSGNVIALDVLRALAREPEGAPAFLAECALPPVPTATSTRTWGVSARGLRRSRQIPQRLSGAPAASSRTWRSRCRRACCCAMRPRRVSDAFCAARLGERGLAFGDLPRGVDGSAIVERSLAL